MTFAAPAPSCCHTSGGELEQIQFLPGHVSVQTTEKYLGCKQNLSHPVNDRFEIAPVRARETLIKFSLSTESIGKVASV